MSKPSALANHIAKTLAPKVRDTRKFRLAKPMVFGAEDASKLVAAFIEAKEISGNSDLTMPQFIVALAENLGKETSKAKIERGLKEVFVAQGGAEAVIVS